MATATGGGWSFAQGTAQYNDPQGNILFTISGFSTSLNAASISAAATVETDSNKKTVKLGAGAFAGLSNNASLTLTSTNNYNLDLADGLATAASINASSLKFSTTDGSGNATVQGKLNDWYYDAGNVLVFHTDSQEHNLATIGGLNQSASLTFGNESKAIQLDTSDLTTLGVSLTAASIDAAKDWGFKLQLVNASNSAVDSLGFDSLASSWSIPSTNNNKTAIYLDNTNQGWTLNDSLHVDYTPSVAAGVATLSGFQSTLNVVSSNNSTLQQGWVASGTDAIVSHSTSSTVTSFAIHSKALSTTSSGISLTTAEDAEGAYKLVFANALSSSVRTEAGESIYGLSAHKNQPYWYHADDATTAIWQYNTDEGWTINEDGNRITYTAAKTSLSTNGTNTATAFASISGLASNISSVNFGDNFATTGSASAVTITVLNSSVLAAGGANGNSLTTFVDTDPNDSVAFSFALSSAIVQQASVNGNPTLVSSVDSGGNASVLGNLNSYHTIEENVVTYHPSLANQPLATLTGLDSGASVEFGGTSKDILILDLPDLKDSGVTLSIGSISGTKNYSLSLALTGADSVYGASGNVNPSVAAFVSLNSSNFEIYGTTYKSYSLSGNSMAVNYLAPESKTLATITGLKAGADWEGDDAEVYVTGTRTINLKQGALSSTNLYINRNEEYGLSFALIDANGSVASSLGFEDSGNYWVVSGESATYQHYTHEGWKYTTATRIDHTDQSSIDVRFSIDGLSNLQATTGEPSVISGIAVDSLNVTVSSNVLDTKDASISGGTGYTFWLKDGNTAGGASKIGFGEDSTSAYWYVGESAISGQSSTAHFVFNTAEGWEVKDSLIAYTEATSGSTAKALMIITGLSTAVDSVAMKGLVIDGDGVIKLTDNVLNSAESSVVSLTTANGGNYSLGLANGVSDVTDASIATGLSGFDSSGIVYVKDTRDAGWSIVSNTNLSYQTAIDTTLASVTGLSSVLNDSLVSYDNKVISLQLGALSQADASITGAGYKLQLVDGDSSVSSFGGQDSGNYWMIAGSSNASYTHYTQEGWSLNAAGTVIDYTAQGGNSNIFTISGLSNLATVKGSNDLPDINSITVDDTAKQIIISTDILVKDSTKVAQISFTEADVNYEILLTENGTDTAAKLGAIAHKDAPYWKVEGTGGSRVAYYTYDTDAGWSVNAAQNQISYLESIAGGSSQYLFKIEGLQGDVTKANLDNLASIGDDGVVKLNSIVIGAAASYASSGMISITSSSEASLNYSLALDSSYTDLPDITNASIATGLSFAGSTVYVKNTRDAGWVFGSNDTILTYTDAVDNILASVTGLASDVNDSLIALDGNTIKIQQGALSANGASLTGGDYSFSLVDSLGAKDSDDKFGFDLSGAHWYIRSDSAAYYQEDQAEGWTLVTTGTKAGREITYTNAMSGATPYKSYAKITGLSTSATADSLNGNASVTAAISVNGGTVTILDSAILGTGTASITRESDAAASTVYKFAFNANDSAVGTKDSLTVWGLKDNAPYYSASSGTVIYQYDTDAGWILGDNTITYQGASLGQGIATISGLSATNVTNTASVEAIGGIALDGKVFTLSESVLPVTDGATVSIAGDGYSFELDSLVPDTEVIDSGVDASVTVSNSNASIMGGTSAYYELAGYSITYHAADSVKALATIAGLSTAAAAANVSLLPNGEGIILLGLSALGTNPVSVTSADISGNYDYKFLLDSDVNQNSDLINYNETNKASVAAVTRGTATLTGTVTAYYDGDNSEVITYHAPTTRGIATISGLKTTATTSNVTANGFVIKIGKDALDTTAISIVENDNDTVHNFSLSFAENVAPSVNGSAYWVVKNGTATYLQDYSAGWILGSDSTSITYAAAKTASLANITGLSLADTAKTNTLAGISVVGGVVKLDTSVLGAGAITLTDTYADDGISFGLSLAQDTGSSVVGDGTGSKDGKVGFMLGDVDLVFKYGTANVQQITEAGWTLRDSTHITYTAPNVSVAAQITGLSVGANSSVVSISADNNTFIVSQSALTNKNVQLTGGSIYKLALDANASVYGFDSEDEYWTTEGTKTVTAKYLKGTGAGYTLGSDSRSIVYTAAKTGSNGDVLATITGLKKGTAADSEGSITGISVADKTIELSNYVLDTSNVVIAGNNGYSLALGSDVSTDSLNTVNYWLAGGTTATYKQDRAAYYTLKGNTVEYNAAENAKVLAVVTGLKSGIKATSIADRPAAVEGINVIPTSASSGTIQISEAALGTNTKTPAKLTNKTGNGNYTLAYSSDGSTSATKVWSYGATTTCKTSTEAATYTPSSDGKSISYTAPKGSTTIITLKGLNKNVDASDIVLYNDLTSTEQSAYSSLGLSAADNAIILKEDALNAATVTLTNAKGANATEYKIVLDSTVASPTLSESKTWSLNKTTATLKGDISAGYTVNDTGTKVTYSKAQTAATLLTISGLPKNVTLNEITTEGKYLTLGEADTDGKIPVTVTEDLLKATTKLTLKGNNYEFVLPASNTTTASGAAAETTTKETSYYFGSILTDKDYIVSGGESGTGKGVDVWRVSGTTATYKRIIPAHYKLTNNNTWSYVKEQTLGTYATITGLQKGLTVTDTFANGVYTNTISGGISISGNNILLSDDVFPASGTVTLTNGTKTGYVGSYSLSFAGGNSIAVAPTALSGISGVWKVSGTTATLKDGTSAGWTINNTATKPTIKYSAATQGSGSTAATITGLKSGLKVDTTTGKISGISVASGGAITLAKSVLGTAKTTTVTDNNDSDGITYSLSASSAVNSDSSGETWTYSGTTLTVKRGQTAGWTYADGKLTYTAAGKSQTTLFTIKGLPKNLALNNDGTVAGITVSGNIITLSDELINKGTSTISLTNGSGQQYQLAMENDKTTTLEDISAWSISGTTATLKSGKSAGYTLTNNRTLTYSKAKYTTTEATIKGITKGLKVTNNTIPGITLDTDGDGNVDTNGSGKKIITLSSDAISAKSNITLTGKNYALSAAADTETAKYLAGAESGTLWEVKTVSGTTTANLYKADTAGYTLSTDGTKLTYSTKATKAGTSALAEVTGLKKGLKVNADGSIDGMTLSGTSVFMLDKRVLGTGIAKITDKDSNDDVTYKLGLDTVDSANGSKYAAVKATAGYKLTVSGTTATVKDFTPAGYTVATNGSSVAYSNASIGAETIATLTGLASGLKPDATGSIAGISVAGTSASGYTITLDKAALGTTDVSVAGGISNVNVTLGLSSTVNNGNTVAYWTSGGTGVAILNTVSTKGYSVGSGSTSINYTATGTTRAVLSGLNSFSISGSGTNTTISGITVNDKTVTISNAGLLGDKVELTGGEYTLALSSITNGVTGGDSNAEWEVTGTTATLKQTVTGTTQNPAYFCDGGTITKVTDTKTFTLATLTGLPEGTTALTNVVSEDIVDGVRTITLPSELLANGSTNIVLSGNGYKLALQNDKVDSPHSTGTTAVWSVKGTTATYATGTTAGYTLSKDSKTATYSAFNTKGGTVKATITGLASGVKPSEVNGAVSSSTITLTNDMLGTSAVTLSNKSSDTKFKLDLDTTTAGSSVATTPTETQAWAVSGTTATYKTYNSAYYKKASDTSITYTAAADAKNDLVTISGLKKGLTVTDGKIDGITFKDKEIVLDADVLSTTNVSLSNGKGQTYKLALGGDVPSPTGLEPYWTFSNGTAKFMQNTSAGYTLGTDGKITYTAAKAGANTLVTLTNLNPKATLTEGVIDGITVDGNTVTVSDNALTTKDVTFTSSGYTLALDTATKSDEEEIWAVSGTTATYKTVTPEHYTLNGNTIKYNKQADVTGGTIATVTGVKSFNADTMFNETEKTITLSTSNLTTSGVKVTSTDGYTLVLGDDVTTYGIDDSTTAWAKTSATAAALKGTATNGYVVSDDGTAVTYKKGGTNQTFASVNGVVDSASFNPYFDVATSTISLDGDELTKAVTVSGSFAYEISNYEDGAIVGSTGADSISVDGDEVTVTGGKGDDYIDLGTSSKGNRFVYKSGDGDDVIANFTNGTDILQIEGTVTAKQSGSDVIVTVKNGTTTGTITLEGFNEKTLTVYDLNDNKSVKGVASADLLESDNFLTADSDLSAITSGSALGDLADTQAFSSSDLTTLTKQSSLVTFGSNKK